MASYDYDFFVIGGGSGGVRAARLVAGMGKKVAIAEEYRYGGTCVIRGCVPKKLLVYASHFSEEFEDAAGYGWTVGESRFDWPTLIRNKDREIARLEGLYKMGLGNAGAEIFESRAELVDNHSVRILNSNKIVTADKILVAVGGRANHVDGLEGHELAITSNEAFDLPELPKAILIAGGGYIAVEFANIFHGLGVETTLIYRGAEILKNFDMDMRRPLHKAMEAKGIRILCGEVISKIVRSADDRLDVTTSAGKNLKVDQTMLAIGRVPNTANLGLDKAGVRVDEAGAIIVDEHMRTSSENIFAVGDVTDRVQLTPVAIHEAMCVVETAFRDNPTTPDHDLIATAVFSQPEIGTVGLSEDEAAGRFDHLEVYRAEFRPMRHTLSGRQEKTIMKLVVNGADRKVLGAHILGPDAGELAQILAITLKAGCSKDDFDRTMAVHPTASEELVTMYQPTYRVENGQRVE
ncbi:MAG: glutathione-disulfide reductase [Alphaproteobacteria bacterium]|nr:glutathione-disulfide reductase [Alphaproteobacteria bacterium]